MCVFFVFVCTCLHACCVFESQTLGPSFSTSVVCTAMGPPDKKKSPKEWRKYLDKQNVRRARQRKVEKEKKFKEQLRPLIREVLRRALKAWSHRFDENVIRANAIMRKNAGLQRCKEELTQRVIKRSAELQLARKDLQRYRKEYDDVEAVTHKEIANIRSQLWWTKRKLRRQW